MASNLAIVRSGTLRPAHQETVFCKTLVVGNTIAAYTATLAILQAGEQVCWAQTGPLDIATDLQLQTADLSTQSVNQSFNWRLGRRASSWETATVMSQSQQAFWDNRQSSNAWPAKSEPSSTNTNSSPAETTPTTKEVQFRQAIAPYLERQQLIVIPQGQPTRVLYSEHREQRRVHQVIFRVAGSKRQFQIHSQLILDATKNAVLQQYLTAVSGQLMATELILTAEQILPAQRGAARSPFFADTIAIVMTPALENHRRSRPISVPLRAMIPKNTEGFLGISLPGCEPALRPLFQQPRAQWAVGESAGHLAAWIVQAGGAAALRHQPHWQWRLQQRLVQQGIPVFAFDDVGLDDPDFEAIQMGAIADVVRTMRHRDLSFRPETPITKAVLASALSRLPALKQSSPTGSVTVADVSANHWAADAIQTVIADQMMELEPSASFAPNKVVTKSQLCQVIRPLYPVDITTPPFTVDESAARRRHLSRALYPILRSRLS